MSQKTTDQIERSAGECHYGFMTGAGYRGKRDDQDEAVQEFARRLAEHFPKHEVEIRFNTNKLSGGAWLVDGEKNSQVGLSAKLTPPYEHRRQFERAHFHDDIEEPKKPRYMDPEKLNLKFTARLKYPAADKSSCNKTKPREDEQTICHEEYCSLEQAWAIFKMVLNPDGVNQPADCDSFDPSTDILIEQ